MGNRVLAWRHQHLSSPIVFLHGFTGGPESWAPLIEGLVERPSRTAFALTLPGHGKGAEVLASTACFETAVDDLARVVDGLNPRPDTLVGYSMGARVGLAILLRHPRLFKKASLLGVHAGLTSDQDQRKRQEDDEQWAKHLEDHGIDSFVDAWAQHPIFRTQRKCTKEILQAQETIRRNHGAYALASALRVLGLGRMGNLWPLLPKLQPHLQLIVGNADQKFLRIGGQIRAAVPCCRLDVIEGAGHNVSLEAQDQLRTLLLHFWQAPPKRT